MSSKSDENLHLRIEIPTRGIETKVTKKFPVTASFDDVINSVKCSLNPLLMNIEFLLKTPDMKSVYQGQDTLQRCGIRNMAEFLMVPVDEGEVLSLLSASSLKADLRRRSASLNTRSSREMSIAGAFIKCGYLVVRVQHRRTNTRKRRWCMMKPNKLFIFANAKDTQPIDTLDLIGDRMSILDSDTVIPRASSGKNALFTPRNESGDMLDSAGLIPIMLIVTQDGASYKLYAEGEEDAKSWRESYSNSRKLDPSTGSETSVKNASVAGYLVRRVHGGGSGSGNKFGKLIGSSLYFSDTPTDPNAQKVELFSQRILFYEDKREIEVSSLGDAGFTMQFACDSDFAEWLHALRTTLPNFVSSGTEFLTVDLKQNVVKSGWMLKKKTSRRFSSAKKRWFVLKGNKLYYMHAPSDEHPIGSVDLLHSQATFYDTVDAEDARPDPRIELVTADGVYVLRLPGPASSAVAELKEWCDCIQANCVGIPFNVVHKQHVDFDLNWSVGNPPDLFAFQEKIGAGAFASVYQGRHRDTGFVLAIKILKLQESTAKTLQQEIDVLRKCHSPQIVSYFGTCRMPGQLWVLTELCRCGSLKDLMKQTFETLNEAQISYVCVETLKGLCYLHAMNIIHHDIKAGNILLTEEGQVKLADFGVSQQFRNTDQVIADNYIGSPLYMSPEVLRKSVYSAKTDVWSLGITVIELAEGAPPNVGVTSFTRLLQLHEKAPPKLHTGGWSSVLHDFIAHCLVVDPAARSSPVDLLTHPFLRTVQKADVIMPLVTQCLKMHDDNKESIPEEFVPPEVAEAISAQKAAAKKNGKGGHCASMSSPGIILDSPTSSSSSPSSSLSSPSIKRRSGLVVKSGLEISEPHRKAPSTDTPLKEEVPVAGTDSIGPPPGTPPKIKGPADLIPPGGQQDSIGPPPGTPPALSPIKNETDSIGPPPTTPPPPSVTPPTQSIPVPKILISEAQKQETSEGTPFSDPNEALELMQKLSTSDPPPPAAAPEDSSKKKSKRHSFRSKKS